MRAYIDTSAVVAVCFGDKQGPSIRSKLRTSEEVLSSSLLIAELLSSFKREARPLREADNVLSGISLIYPDSSLRSECEKILQMRYLRGADLWHLATALNVVGGVPRRNLLFISLDDAQRNLAHQLGFRTWPRC